MTHLTQFYSRLKHCENTRLIVEICNIDTISITEKILNADRL